MRKAEKKYLVNDVLIPHPPPVVMQPSAFHHWHHTGAATDAGVRAGALTDVPHGLLTANHWCCP